jgi:hypothetical protein
MQDGFTPTHTATGDLAIPPSCPRRLLNEREYRDDLPESRMSSADKIRLRFANRKKQIMVNDAGMVPEAPISGLQS